MTLPLNRCMMTNYVLPALVPSTEDCATNDTHHMYPVGSTATLGCGQHVSFLWWRLGSKILIRRVCGTNTHTERHTHTCTLQSTMQTPNHQSHTHTWIHVQPLFTHIRRPDENQGHRHEHLPHAQTQTYVYSYKHKTTQQHRLTNHAAL